MSTGNHIGINYCDRFESIYEADSSEERHGSLECWFTRVKNKIEDVWSHIKEKRNGNNS